MIKSENSTYNNDNGIKKLSSTNEYQYENN